MTRRKKVLDDAGVIEGIPDLKDDEQLVSEVTTKRTVRKEKTPAVDLEPENVVEISDEEVETEDEEPAYSATSLAALIYSSEDEPLHNQFCTVAVRRNPDGMNDRFATPCASVLHLPRLINIELSADRADIEDRVRGEYGGGHYFFQVHYNNRLASSWKATLADLPAHLRQVTKPEPEVKEPPPPTVPDPVNPFDQFFDALEKQHRLKEMLFGEEQRRMQAEIERLRTEAAAAKPEPTNQSDLALLLGAMRETNNTGIIDFAKEYLSPENREPQFGVWDFAKYLFDNKDQVAGLASMMLGGMLPSPKPAADSIENLMRQQPPSASLPAESPPGPPPVRSAFQRRRIERPETAGDGITIDNDTISETVGRELTETNESDLATDQME